MQIVNNGQRAISVTDPGLGAKTISAIYFTRVY